MNQPDKNETVAVPPEDFILPEDYANREEPSENPNPRFRVLPHLALLALILFALFSALILPQAFSSLQFASVATPPTPVATAVVSELPANPWTEINLTAEAVHVWDIAEQQTLFSKNADEKLPLASITKLMTALLSYELVEDDTLVTISPAAARQESGGWFLAGEKYRAKELADFSLITSHNSAAYTLADAVGALLGYARPVEQFVQVMNIRSAELGLHTFEFNNPTGLDISDTIAGGYGSAYDVNRLMEYIVKNHPEILLPTITPEIRLYNTGGSFHEADNTNNLVSEFPGLVGSKTGFTDLAGGNLTIVFDAGFNRLVAITVLGSTRANRFTDVKALVNAVQSTLTSNPSPQN